MVRDAEAHAAPDKLKKDRIEASNQGAEEEYAYPELAAKAKQKGYEFFKKGDYRSAVKHYSGAIRSVKGLYRVTMVV